MKSMKIKTSLLLILISSQFIFTSSINAEIEYNERAGDLAFMHKKGKIKESAKKEALLESGIDRHFTKTFKDLGCGYRIDTIVPLWKLFEDDGYFILMGSVYENADTGFLFVWVLKDNVRTTGDINTVFLELGGQKIIGKKYPKGIIPHKSWW